MKAAGAGRSVQDTWTTFAKTIFSEELQCVRTCITAYTFELIAGAIHSECVCLTGDNHLPSQYKMIIPMILT